MPDEPRNLNRRTSSSNDGSSVPDSSRPRNVRRESSDDRIEVGVDLLARFERDADRAAALDDDVGDRRVHPDLGAERLGRAADRVADPAGPALGDAPRPERAVDLAHVVVEQDVGRARALDALVGADDPGRGHRRLERVRLEPLVEELRRAHRHELDEDRLLALRQRLEAAGEAGQRHQRPRVDAGQVGRGDGQDRLDEAGHLDHQLAVFLVRLGVARRPAAQLADRPAVVVDPPQVVAAAGLRALALVQRRDRPVERQDVEAVLRQLEVADDLGPQQRHDVGEDREAEAREDLLGDRRAAEHVALLEDERLEPGAGEICGADEAVVAATDDDGVVGLGQGIGPPTAIQTAYV